MNLFTLLVVLVIWIPVGASSLAALFIVVALMGVGTGSFVPLGGEKFHLPPFPSLHVLLFFACPLDGRQADNDAIVQQQQTQSRASTPSAAPSTRGHGWAWPTAWSHLRNHTPPPLPFLLHHLLPTPHPSPFCMALTSLTHSLPKHPHRQPRLSHHPRPLRLQRPARLPRRRALLGHDQRGCAALAGARPPVELEGGEGVSGLVSS